MVGPSVIPHIVVGHGEVVLVGWLLLGLGFVFALDLLFDFGNSPIAPPMQFLVLLDLLSELFLSDDALDQLVVVTGDVEPWEDLHHIIDLFLALWSGFLELDLLLQVQDAPAQHELLLLVPLSQPLVVDLNNFELEFPLLLRVLLGELHFGQQQFGLVVVLELVVIPEWHVPHDFGSGAFSRRFLHVDGLYSLGGEGLPVFVVLVLGLLGGRVLVGN